MQIFNVHNGGEAYTALGYLMQLNNHVLHDRDDHNIKQVQLRKESKSTLVVACNGDLESSV